VVRDEGAIGDGRLGGADVHAVVERHGVHAHDLGVEARCKIERQPALARTGRPGENQNIAERIGAAHASDCTHRQAVMPSIVVCHSYRVDPAVLLDFFRRPANLAALAPAELNLVLVEAPLVVEIGSRFVVDVRRWGVRQRIVTEVVSLDDRSIREEQRKGPFRAWTTDRTFRSVEDGAEVHEQVAFEPPGGMLGMVLTAARIEADLRAALAYRHARLLERLGG
jgi:ligand-binding SRPBCC domain-containing protein